MPRCPNKKTHSYSSLRSASKKYGKFGRRKRNLPFRSWWKVLIPNGDISYLLSRPCLTCKNNVTAYYFPLYLPLLERLLIFWICSFYTAKPLLDIINCCCCGLDIANFCSRNAKFCLICSAFCNICCCIDDDVIGLLGRNWTLVRLGFLGADTAETGWSSVISWSNKYNVKSTDVTENAITLNSLFLTRNKKKYLAFKLLWPQKILKIISQN